MNKMFSYSNHSRFVAILLCGCLMAAPDLTFASGKPATGKPAARKASITTRHITRSLGVPTFADSTVGDVAAYDDPVVRAASVYALGRYNGSVVALDPNTGRILSIVNQKLAFSSGFIPCSTIKPVIAVAATPRKTSSLATP